jgi:hypothetical protein
VVDVSHKYDTGDALNNRPNVFDNDGKGRPFESCAYYVERPHNGEDADGWMVLSTDGDRAELVPLTGERGPIPTQAVILGGVEVTDAAPISDVLRGVVG